MNDKATIWWLTTCLLLLSLIVAYETVIIMPTVCGRHDDQHELDELQAEAVARGYAELAVDPVSYRAFWRWKEAAASERVRPPNHR